MSKKNEDQKIGEETKKKELALEVIRRLKEEHPDAGFWLPCYMKCSAAMQRRDLQRSVLGAEWDALPLSKWIIRKGLVNIYGKYHFR